jgi:hypothetical protein
MRKRWLLLLLIPVAIVAVPVLLFGMLIGTRLLSMVAGPVNIFNTPGHAPSAAEIAGYYRLSKDVNRAPRGGILSERAGFSLGSDHRLEMTEMPAFDGFGESRPTISEYRDIDSVSTRKTNLMRSNGLGRI